MPQFPVVRWGWWRVISLHCRSWERDPVPAGESQQNGGVWTAHGMALAVSSSERLRLCLVCLSVQKDKLPFRSGVCFFTLKTKGAPLIPFTMSHCDFTWNCSPCLPREWDEIKLWGIYLFAFWAGMCGCLFSRFCSEPARTTWRREEERVNKRPLFVACSVQESRPSGWQFPRGWADKGDLFSM